MPWAIMIFGGGGRGELDFRIADANKTPNFINKTFLPDTFM